MNSPRVLNTEQQRAVETISGRILILAGAGSGKTSVLTHRIVHLLTEHRVAAKAILGLTFTNKAALEMRERIATMVDPTLAKQLTLCTFHSFCMQVLRKEIQRLGYTSSFSLYDEQDVRRLVKQMARHILEHDGDLPSIGSTMERIADARSRGESSIQCADGAPWHDRFTKEIYERLQGCMRAHNAVDFDSLLSLTNELFQQFPDVLARYQQRFLYIMIDEYQDTNPLQYRLACALSASHGNLCVVGDDDQSIYGWRGAEVEHILTFPADTLIKLEQNYRSTPTILHAANAVIAHNTRRHGKHLFSAKDLQSSALIELFHAPTETDEATAVVERIIHLRQKHNMRWGEIAILYRSNVLARNFEKALMDAVWKKEGHWIRGIPYRVFGGTEMYERSEIKDVLAYLKTISNPLDEAAILRIINVPRRGISDKALDLLTQAHRNASDLSLWQLLCSVADNDATSRDLVASLSAKALQGMQGFVALIRKYQQEFQKGPLHVALVAFLEEVNYRRAIAEDVKSEKMRECKWENVQLCVASLQRFEEDEEDDGRGLIDFLADTLLDEEKWKLPERREECIHLMTFHSAKGLEFSACFLACLEDHVLPHAKSILAMGVEEERRLFYVALTRAKEFVFLSMACTRKQMGAIKNSTPSRFLYEIPRELLHMSLWNASVRC